MAATPRIFIIGIGSPAPGDDLGLLAARQLRRQPWVEKRADVIEVMYADRPGLRLLDLWRSATHVVLLDAAATGARPGTIRRWQVLDLVVDPTPHRSSHDFGVVQVIALARALDLLPRSLAVWTIEADAANPDSFSDWIEPALAGLTEQVVEQLKHWLHAEQVI